MSKKTIFIISAAVAVLLAGFLIINSNRRPADTSNAVPSGKTVTISLTAKKFQFDPAQIKVNLGDRIIINFTSLDVMHGFAIDEYGINQTAGPGETKQLNFLADKAGTFTFRCSVPCGPGHLDMTGSLIVAAAVSAAPALAPAVKDNLAEPIKNAKARVTKKPFGLKVSPGHSPVSPERFSGYHAGVDFETTAAEQNQDVPVYALCGGSLLLKKWVSGYGGAAVERCRLSGQIVTVLYGHLKLASIKPKAGARLAVGAPIGILGKGYSAETDGERKHLHLGIHKGAPVNFLGYVKNKAELKDWLDVLTFGWKPTGLI